MANDDIRPRRKTAIEIPLPSIRKYAPGSGPPLPRISLVPPRDDSTAYIIDQFVLPTDKDMTETSRRLIHYHIGFTDLPAVKILVPCHEVLDYISPHELEDWEYKNLDRKEEERARRLAEQQRTGGPKKKKPGRAPKIFTEDMNVPALSPGDEALLLAQEVAGPSLSTPKSRKFKRMVDEEDTEDTSNIGSDDAAIRQQLEADAEPRGMLFEDDFEADSESVDQLALDYHTPLGDTTTRSGSLALPPQNSAPGSAPAATGETGLANSAITPPPGRIHQAWAHALSQQNWSERSPDAPNHNGHATLSGTPWSLLAKQQQHKPSAASSSGSGSTHGTASGSKGPASRVSTPGQAASSAGIPYPSASKRKGVLPSDEGSTERKKQKKSKHMKQTTKVEGEPAADEWEVKELLDDGWFFEDGTKAHKFLVLWEGDWPEDQNPTWEPAENIQHQDLIKRYEKKKKASLLKPPRKIQKTLHQYLAGAMYSSVAEAFEGGIEEQPGPSTTGIESDTDPPDETFLVTEDAGDIASHGAKQSPSFGAFDSLLTRYNQNFPRV